jgi:hypothetical protein
MCIFPRAIVPAPEDVARSQRENAICGHGRERNGNVNRWLLSAAKANSSCRTWRTGMQHVREPCEKRISAPPRLAACEDSKADRVIVQAKLLYKSSVIACVSGCTSGLRGDCLSGTMYTCRVLEIKHAWHALTLLHPVCLAENCTITGRKRPQVEHHLMQVRGRRRPDGITEAESDVGSTRRSCRPSDVHRICLRMLSRTLNYPLIVPDCCAARVVEGALDPPHAATFLALAGRDNFEKEDPLRPSCLFLREDHCVV